MKVTAVVLIVMVLAAGCRDYSYTSQEYSDATLSGNLTVLLDVGLRLVVEEEINDGLDSTQFLGWITPSEKVSILGDVSISDGDPVDFYEFVVNQFVNVRAVLTYSQDSADPQDELDLIVYDFNTSGCSPRAMSDDRFSICFENDGRSERGSFSVDDRFVILVAAYRGGTDYQLDVEVSTPNWTWPSSLTTTSPPSVQRHVAKNNLLPEILPHTIEYTEERSDCEDLVIRFVDGVTVAQQDALLNVHRLHCIERSPSGWARVGPADDQESRSTGMSKLNKAVSSIRCNDLVESAELNRRTNAARVPNDKYFKLQWNYDLINLQQAWDMTVGSDDAVIAVIDTGVVLDHPDLKGCFADGYDFIADPVSARDGDGRDSDPTDEGDEQGGPGLSSFHGTHVTGTLAASTNNLRGTAGITWQTKIMPLRVLGVGGGTAFDIAEAIRYAAGLPNVSGLIPARPARIINLSLGDDPGRESSPVRTAAIKDAVEAGVLVVAAAGNGASDQPAYPAAHPEVISVSAVGMQLQLAAYSNYGGTIDLTAPGGLNETDINGDGFPDGILSTSARDYDGLLSLRYDYSVGTSMAAPHVAGAAALTMAANPMLSAIDVRIILESTARDLGTDGRDDQFGYGLVDAAAAVREARRWAGLAVDEQASLGVSTDTLRFAPLRSQLRAAILNSGDEYLNVDSVVVEETNGSGWLRAALRGTSAGNANADEILVTVDRTNQTEDLLRGELTLYASNGDSVTIDVTAEMDQEQPPDEMIYVVATRQGEPDFYAQTTTDASRSFEFAFEGLPPGDYVVFAGTDRNGDGDICEYGDLCGGYPSQIAPQTLTISAGADRAGIDFAVSRRLLRRVISINDLLDDAANTE